MIGTLALGACGLFAALLAHEASHALAARALPHASVSDVSLYPRAYVDYSVREDAERTIALVSMAPTIVGLLAGLGFLFVGALPETATTRWLFAIVCWTAFTLPSTDDVAPREIGTEAGARERGVAGMFQGFVVALAAWAAMSVTMGTTFELLFLAVAIAALGYAGLEVHDAKRAIRAGA